MSPFKLQAPPRSARFRFSDERGPVGDDLLDLRGATREARHAGRPGQDERRDFFGEALDIFAILTSHADSHGTSGSPARVARERPVRGVDADELGQICSKRRPSRSSARAGCGRRPFAFSKAWATSRQVPTA